MVPHSSIHVFWQGSTIVGLHVLARGIEAVGLPQVIVLGYGMKKPLSDVDLLSSMTTTAPGLLNRYIMGRILELDFNPLFNVAPHVKREVYSMLCKIGKQNGQKKKAIILFFTFFLSINLMCNDLYVCRKQRLMFQRVVNITLNKQVAMVICFWKINFVVFCVLSSNNLQFLCHNVVLG